MQKIKQNWVKVPNKPTITVGEVCGKDGECILKIGKHRFIKLVVKK